MRQEYSFKEGERIGDEFQVIKIGISGGMGQVYLCYSHARDYFYALKGLNERTLPFFARDPFQFRREVETWVGLGQHENIVRCFTVLMFENHPLILAEWVGNDRYLAELYEGFHRGQPHFLDWYARLGEQGLDLRMDLSRTTRSNHEIDLESYLTEKIYRDNPTLAVAVALDICAGLMHIKQVFPGTAHGDLRPTNILITSQGRAKINDFGIARLFCTTSPTETLRWQGSPLHMAPEQWLEQPTDCRTDIYTLGVILFTLLMGHEPFDAPSRSTLR